MSEWIENLGWVRFKFSNHYFIWSKNSYMMPLKSLEDSMFFVELLRKIYTEKDVNYKKII